MYYTKNGITNLYGWNRVSFIEENERVIRQPNAFNTLFGRETYENLYENG
jgi:hypothetical protein